MAIVPRDRVTGCDGFRVESPSGLLGWVEETWLGPAGQPAALAVRCIDGQRALLQAEDVEAVLDEGETVVVAHDVALLELDVPRIDGTGPAVHASWGITGATIDPPRPLGLLRRLVLARRPWRLAPPRAPREWPIWQIAVLLYAGIVLLAVIVITAALIAARALA
jgi:hypothetical protein